MQRLIKLAPDSNPFLRVIFRPPTFKPEFWVNKNVWVEIYYTENVPLNWGRFDTIIATGAGTSRVGGLPHNKQCQLCNLYPQKSNSSARIASSRLNSTFELLLHLERKRLGSSNINESADLIETICNVIDSIVGQNAHMAENGKNKSVSEMQCKNIRDVRKKAELKTPEEIMRRLDEAELCEEMQDCRSCLKRLISDMNKGMTQVERLLNEARQCSMRSTFFSQLCSVR
ncbi:unnamed protein product [Gongylonema pulchrum]|uniref:Fer2_3 domain-containing protein n=1 Tax=Gongylonema pulchrum TaxID=637853 RepID=A0A183E0B2_9BILA|nr:unnamed protein product [Gongylonema pulchrum]